MFGQRETVLHVLLREHPDREHPFLLSPRRDDAHPHAVFMGGDLPHLCAEEAGGHLHSVPVPEVEGDGPALPYGLGRCDRTLRRDPDDEWTAHRNSRRILDDDPRLGAPG